MISLSIYITGLIDTDNFSLLYLAINYFIIIEFIS